VFRYKGNEKDFKKIAEELKVQAILTGEVVQRGEQLVLSLELIDSATENHIWGDTYTRNQSDIVSLQSEIARDVSESLKTKISGEEQTKLASSGTTNAEAYQAYLKGRYFLTKGTVEAPEDALKYFQDAVTLDPNFALGYAGLADCYALIGSVMQTQRDPFIMMPKAREAAEKAIQLNPNLSEAYVSLAWVKFRYDWDWAGAEKEFRKAIQLNPNNAQAHQWYGELLSVIRRDDEAIAELKKAVEIEPFNLLMIWNLGKTYHDSGRFNEAVAEMKRVYEMDKNFRRLYRVLRQSYEALGKKAEAFDTFIQERILMKDPPERIEKFKQTYKKDGYDIMIGKFLDGELQNDKSLNASFRVVYYRALGDKEKTLYWLEEAYKKHESGVLYLKNQTYDFMKDDPRFQALLKKMNFPN
jgi:tetratricopeptide (TPR) repeat protein